MEPSVLISLMFVLNLFGSSMSDCVNSICEGFTLSKSQFQESEPFFEEKTRVYVECCSLCASIYKCASFNYDVKTHKCSLMANASDALTDKWSTISGRYVKESDQHSNRVCRTRPCKPDQVCVEMTSGNGYICLQDLFTPQAPTSDPTCEVAPPIEHMISKRSSSDLSGAEAFYTCDTGFRETSGSGHSVCAEDGRWTRPSLVCEVVDCGTPPDSSIHRVEFVNTTYHSNAVYLCGLGYIPSTVTSVCRANGTWSPTCQEIPYLKGTKTMPASSESPMECRNVLSEPVSLPYDPDGVDIVRAKCAADEILTGCSALNLGSTLRGSKFPSATACTTRIVFGTQSVARCCKIPGLQCEYIKSETCYKSFQLLDCACWGKGSCYSTMTNNTCVPNSLDKDHRYVVCCASDNMICYVKEALGSESPRSQEMTIRCGPGETMTACSGFNKDESIEQAFIEDREGEDTCVVLPGEGSFSTLKGYVSCCKLKR